MIVRLQPPVLQLVLDEPSLRLFEIIPAVVVDVFLNLETASVIVHEIAQAVAARFFPPGP